ncbi:MAG: EAL domain-containing protein [Actinomycetota bacterium]|nr:EAL domain-containing protein [Actinomycetota bacterium]
MLLNRVRPLYLYVASVISSGSLILGFLIVRDLHSVPARSFNFWVLGVAVVLSELVPIRVARTNEVHTVTISGMFVFALLLLHGVTWTCVVLSVASIVDDVFRRKVWWKSAFNVAQYTLSVSAGGAMLELTTRVVHGDLSSNFSAGDVPGILVAAGTLFAVNWLLLGLGVAFAKNAPIISSFRQSYGHQTIADALLFAVAPVVVAVADYTFALLPLLALPLIGVYRSALVSLENIELVDTLRHQAEKNQHLALHDGLTGLPNRMLFRQRIEEAVKTASSGDRKALVMLLDLDRFKEVNDALGHHYGDELLREVARRLQETLRDGDTVARLGGDEFGVLLPGLSKNVAPEALAKKILRSFEDSFALPGLTLRIRGSIGGAVFPEHGADPDTLIRKADIAMYASKEVKSGWEMYDSSHDHNSRARLALVEELRKAIDDGELDLYYQPKAKLPGGEIEGVEALLRWNHPSRGFVSPDVFIPLAEHTDLIHPLTMFVLKKALNQAREWHITGYDLKVAVNLSSHNLLDADLAARVSKMLHTARVPASALEFEITETSIIADPVRARDVLVELHQLGISVALDDFGTGYTSLSYLTRLPLDTIKIDRSFVMNMLTDAKDAAIVQSTIDLAKHLGISVVAEGVEDEATWNQLALLRCDIAQGYCLARPMPSTDLVEWLAARFRPGPKPARSQSRGEQARAAIEGDFGISPAAPRL